MVCYVSKDTISFMKKAEESMLLFNFIGIIRTYWRPINLFQLICAFSLLNVRNILFYFIVVFTKFSCIYFLNCGSRLPGESRGYWKGVATPLLHCYKYVLVRKFSDLNETIMDIWSYHESNVHFVHLFEQIFIMLYQLIDKLPNMFKKIFAVITIVEI